MESSGVEIVRQPMGRGDLLLIAALLATFGTVVAAYLTWQWYASASAPWCDLNEYFSCSKVRESPYAAVAGIPTATIGVAGFLLLLAFAVFALRGRDQLGPWSVDRWILVVAFLGAIAGLGLTFLEIFVIQAICILCVIGFALDLGILAASAILVRGSTRDAVAAET